MSGGPQQEPAEASAEGEARARAEETLGTIQTRIAKHKDFLTGKPFELDLDTLTHLSAESLRGELGQREWGPPGSTERRKVMAQELGALCDKGDARRDDVQEFCRWVERHRAERETEKRRQSRGATPEKTLGSIQMQIAMHRLELRLPPLPTPPTPPTPEETTPAQSRPPSPPPRPGLERTAAPAQPERKPKPKPEPKPKRKPKPKPELELELEPEPRDDRTWGR